MTRYAVRFDSPVGELVAQATDEGLELIEFADSKLAAQRVTGVEPPPGAEPAAITQVRDELRRYFGGELREFRTPLAAPGTAFQHAVWAELRRIPYGETRSYAEVARRIGRPTAVRAVARANATNPISILVPCHRVIGKDGTLTGYGGGLERKRWLLELEGATAGLFKLAT
ncbi:MAG: methylated-DNA--[protein]-cysteine S-methyltransferase [Lacipirellulaceae bacterium]